MARLASNKNTRPQQPMWLRDKSPNDQAFIQQGHKATTTKWLRKTNISNDLAFIQQEHKATTTNVIKKQSSNEQAGIQQEHKATTTNVLKKNMIQWAGSHPTRTQGDNDQCD